MEVQEVKVIARACGDYAAFHEMSIYVEYDLTNDIQLNEHSKEELMKRVDSNGDYCDYDTINAIKIGGSYYMPLN